METDHEEVTEPKAETDHQELTKSKSETDHEATTDHDADTLPVTPSKTLPPVTKIPKKRAVPRRRNPFLGVLLLLLGILLGIFATLFSLLFLIHDHPPVKSTSSTQASQISVQVSSVYLTRVVEDSLQTANLPGKISNVQVSLTNNNTIIITGNDKISLLFFDSTQPFTITLQLYAQSCQPRINILSAHLGSLPITSFVQSYNTEINQEIQQSNTNLPSGFTYCVTSTRTQPDALFIIYSATPK